jgi:hypothetical protein
MGCYLVLPSDEECPCLEQQRKDYYQDEGYQESEPPEQLELLALLGQHRQA